MGSFAIICVSHGSILIDKVRGPYSTMKVKNYTPSNEGSNPSSDALEFRTEVVEKIRLIAAREAGADQKGEAKASHGDMRMSVRTVLEKFQQEIIRQNIWIRIYDDHGSNLPAFDQKACQAIEKIMENALRRHQSGKLLAYVEISFLINETGTVITVEDNAPSLTAEEVGQLTFLQHQNVTTLASGYTLQATVGDTCHSISLGQVSMRCVANCFTRFTVCFPH